MYDQLTSLGCLFIYFAALIAEFIRLGNNGLTGIIPVEVCDLRLPGDGWELVADCSVCTCYAAANCTECCTERVNCNSPQEKASKWLAENPGPGVGDDPNIRYILAVLYYSTNGDDWIDKGQWLSNTSVCTWHGYTCVPSSPGSKQESLILSSNNLVGTIPSEIGSLPSLSECCTLRDSLLPSCTCAWYELTHCHLMFVHLAHIT